MDTPGYIAICSSCGTEFNLFVAAFCTHPEPRSKHCPHCGLCLCPHPDPERWEGSAGVSDLPDRTSRRD